ncbi:MAG: 5-formyltetrahydrofolate cyclo-ligase [Alphaproteobacteria bacterium]|jgi:5-formyltetrahydrofolate cyclo-ligase
MQGKGNAEDARKQLRLSFRKKRKALSACQQENAAHNIVKMAVEHDLFVNIGRVALYISHDGELDTQHLINYLWEQEKEVYLPVLHPFCAGYLVFLRYSKNSPMTYNKFGILEPVLDVTKLCPLNKLGLILTPLVAFDESGNRLGMGGGFYDRTLQFLRGNNDNSGALESNSSINQIKIIGLAHDVQKTLSLPIEVWDIPLPEILTPSNMYSF